MDLFSLFWWGREAICNQVTQGALMDIQSIGGGELGAAPSRSVKSSTREVKSPKSEVKSRTDTVDVHYGAGRGSEELEAEVEIEDAEVVDASLDQVDKQKIIERKMGSRGTSGGGSRYYANIKKQVEHESNTAIYDRVVQAYKKQKGMLL